MTRKRNRVIRTGDGNSMTKFLWCLQSEINSSSSSECPASLRVCALEGNQGTTFLGSRVGQLVDTENGVCVPRKEREREKRRLNSSKRPGFFLSFLGSQSVWTGGDSALMGNKTPCQPIPTAPIPPAPKPSGCIMSAAEGSSGLDCCCGGCACWGRRG